VFHVSEPGENDWGSCDSPTLQEEGVHTYTSKLHELEAVVTQFQITNPLHRWVTWMSHDPAFR
jgi:hypothetical protein